MKKNSNKLKAIVRASLGTVILISATGCSLLPKEEAALAPPLVEPAQIEYDVAEVELGDITTAVRGSGNFIPLESHDLFYTQDGGRLKNIHISEGELVEKGQLLAEIETGTLLFDIEQLEIELKKAKIRLQQLKAQKADTYSLQIGELDLEGLELRLAQLQSILNKSKITSPIDGVVTFVTDSRQGEILGAYQSIIQVADTTNLLFIYTALSADVVNEVTIGMEATIDYRDSELKGNVVQTPNDIPSDIYETNPDLYGRSILVRLEELPNEIGVGERADIELITAEKENALLIPKSALRTAVGRSYVQIVDGQTKKEQDIEVGIISTTEVEVIKGLNEGDKVILR
ncbi:efflux RND transporter periplasmic adaptor subunit [Halalkalibacter akibai]|uniref:Probable Co/Zn/Cd efflux system membrane fusion protein n=1 Tax=Halalkalibacter akibai (strain ATCC 43226 / DSM 21942 / CIP 109018 / JCM 9157 / 1139) TaxID=1236973 RepID=W4QWU5_HALA3|nr:HlyD family efflux transporter periplasmic adaptor subunit [Halalkalibacter akibai]GAE36377.1 probable Co/Zn/Cd efflux system membrane fusion protein [Halalkalibacter akibai JCM 9157]